MGVGVNIKSQCVRPIHHFPRYFQLLNFFPFSEWNFSVFHTGHLLLTGLLTEFQVSILEYMDTLLSKEFILTVIHLRQQCHTHLTSLRLSISGTYLSWTLYIRNVNIGNCRLGVLGVETCKSFIGIYLNRMIRSV
jgi:hypothetical protein